MASDARYKQIIGMLVKNDTLTENKNGIEFELTDAALDLLRE